MSLTHDERRAKEIAHELYLAWKWERKSIDDFPPTLEKQITAILAEAPYYLDLSDPGEVVYDAPGYFSLPRVTKFKINPLPFRSLRKLRNYGSKKAIEILILLSLIGILLS